MRTILVLLIVVLAGCDSPPAPPTPDPNDRLQVVASVYPLASIARQIGGERVDVSWWIESGQTLIDYRPTPEQVTQMRRAAAILTNGRTEAAHTDQFSVSFGDQRVIRLDRFTDYDATDAQLWLNTELVKRAATELTERLAALDPAHAPDYRRRNAEVQVQLDLLGAAGQSQIAPWAGRSAASVGKDYTALAKQLGLTIEPLSRRPAVAMDDADWSRLPGQLKTAGAGIILIEADTPAGVVDQLKRLVAVPVVMIDSLGTSAATGRNEYEKIMRFNYDQLAKGLAGRR